MRNVRVRYEKTGDAKFVSHLDLVRAFSRAIRRAGFKVYYSEGFNPHIKIQFLPPLSLGYESLCEAFDIKVLDKTADDEIIERLCAVLPETLRITRAYEPQSSFSDIASVLYGISFEGDVDEAVRVLKGRELFIEKKTKRGQINVDIAATLLSVENSGGELRVVLPMCEGSINPRHVVEALNVYGNMKIEDFRCVRRELFDVDGKIFL